MVWLQGNERRAQGLGKNDGLEKEPYSFVVLGDTQFGMMRDMFDNQWKRVFRYFARFFTFGMVQENLIKNRFPVPYLDQQVQSAEELDRLEMEMSERAVQAIQSLDPKPKFAVVCGDLVHAYPQVNLEANTRQVEVFKRIWSKVEDVPLVCVCGNHDLGEAPTPEMLELWRSRFGDDYFSFEVGPDRFIVINSQLYKNDANAKAQSEAQDQWLDTALAENARHKIVMSHIPPFIEDPEEVTGYFPLSKTIRMDLLSRMAKNGVSHWFSGHFHRNAQGTYTDENGNQVEVVTTGAVGGNLTSDPEGQLNDLSGMSTIKVSTDLSGIRIVNVTPQGIRHEFQTLDNFPYNTK